MRRKAQFKDEIRHIYEETAASLAADRQTRTLPVVIAELFFIGGWVISLIKASSSEPNPTNWVNVEAQSIAISALYLWVTSTVVLASFIGASQTEDAVPRILHGFEYQLAAFHSGRDRRPSMNERVDTDWCRRSIIRAVCGGTYSWRPMKWKGGRGACLRSTRDLIGYSCIATLFIGCSLLVSVILSYLVSPRGFSCRHIAEIMVLVDVLLIPKTVMLTFAQIRILGTKLCGRICMRENASTADVILGRVLERRGIRCDYHCYRHRGAVGHHEQMFVLVGMGIYMGAPAAATSGGGRADVLHQACCALDCVGISRTSLLLLCRCHVEISRCNSCVHPERRWPLEHELGNAKRLKARCAGEGRRDTRRIVIVQMCVEC